MPLYPNAVKQFANAFGHAWLINTAFGARDPKIPLGKGNISYGDVQVSISCPSVFLSLDTNPPAFTWELNCP